MENLPDPDTEALVKLMKTYDVPVEPILRVIKDMHSLTLGTGVGRIMIHFKNRKVTGIQVREDWFAEDNE